MPCRSPSLLVTLLVFGLWSGCGEEISNELPLDQARVRAAEAVAGLDLTTSERSLMLSDLIDQRNAYGALRARQLDNAVPPALRFDPWLNTPGLEGGDRTAPTPPRWPDPGPQQRPANLDDLAFADVPTLEHKLGVLAAHGEAVGRDVREVEISVEIRERTMQFPSWSIPRCTDGSTRRSSSSHTPAVDDDRALVS